MVRLSWAQPDSSVIALVGCPWHRGSVRYEFFSSKIWMHILLHQTKEKTNDETESNEPQSVVTQSNELQSFVTQTIPGWPKYLMAKSQNENTPLTKLNPFKLAKRINDITKSRIADLHS